MAGDVLFNITGDGITFGRACIVPRSILPACVNQHVTIIRPDPERCSPGYLLSYLTHPLVKGYIESFNAGGSRRAVTKGNIKSFQLPLPPLAQQQAIAEILGSLDDKIELNRRTNETLEGMARAIFRSWFVDFDPVRAKAAGRQPSGMDAATAALFPDRFEDSPRGKIPKGWTIRRLAEMTSKIGSGATPRGGSKVYIKTGVALIRSQNVHDHEFNWGGIAYISDDAAHELRGVVVEPDDVLLNITGDSILRTCVVDPAVLPARVNQHVAIIRACPDVPHRYLHLYLVRPEMKHFLLGFDAGGTRKALTKGHLESIQVPLPPGPLLDIFRAVTDPLFARAVRNRTSLVRSPVSGMLSYRSCSRGIPGRQPQKGSGIPCVKPTFRNLRTWSLRLLRTFSGIRDERKLSSCLKVPTPTSTEPISTDGTAAPTPGHCVLRSPCISSRRRSHALQTSKRKLATS